MIQQTHIQIAGVIATVIFVALIAFVLVQNMRRNDATPVVAPQPEVPLALPTVSPDVKVELISVQPKKEIQLKVSGVPSGTTTIEYELTYSTAEQASEGVFSSARPSPGESSFSPNFERKITLGTCSRNVCRYHEITSDIVVRLRFEGGYGAQIYEGEFPTDDL